jgi:crotonobetainyl-CoA:carnitine CoA-transferase CaiB-like acyl-CoA transferase
VAGHPEWQNDVRFKDLASRMANARALDSVIGAWTRGCNEYQLMQALQSAGVPAGVCQHAGDRCDNDPQLKHLEWLTEVTGTKIGRWPVAEVPIKLHESPAYIGGRIDRGAPCYGEDNEYVFGELLGMSTAEIKKLEEEGVT